MATKLELLSDVWLGEFTLCTLIFIMAEYIAEHSERWKWGHARTKGFAVLVVIGLAGELFTEAGSFWYSYLLQESQSAALSSTEATAKAANEAAGEALTNAAAASNEASNAAGEADDAARRLSGLSRREQAAETEVGNFENAMFRVLRDPKALTAAESGFPDTPIFLMNEPGVEAESLESGVKLALGGRAVELPYDGRRSNGFGVSILTQFEPNPSKRGGNVNGVDPQAWNTALALCHIFWEKEGIFARDVRDGPPKPVPSNGILIVIGKNPNPYLDTLREDHKIGAPPQPIGADVAKFLADKSLESFRCNDPG